MTAHYRFSTSPPANSAVVGLCSIRQVQCSPPEQVSHNDEDNAGTLQSPTSLSLSEYVTGANQYPPTGTGVASSRNAMNFSTSYAKSPKPDVTVIRQQAQQPRQNRPPQLEHRDDYEYEPNMMGRNTSIGAPTPTSTSSSYGGATKEDGNLANVYGGRRESDFGTEDTSYSTTMHAKSIGESGPQGYVTTPDYMDSGGAMDVEEEPGGEDGQDTRHDIEFRQEGMRGVLKMKAEGEGQEQTPTWSETKTKAGKDRKRLPLACIQCRRKKIRCSGEKPACKHCVRSRTPCVYKQSTRKTAPRTDYMSMLDRRLKRMEERLLKNVPKEEIGAVIANTGRSVVKPSASNTAKKRAADAAFEDDLEVWAYSSYLPKSRNVTAIGRNTNSSSDDGAHALPPREIQEHLAEVFFEFIYGQPYLLLHKPSFMRRLKSGTAPPVLMLAICAVSARFSKHPAVKHEPPFLAGERFATEARRQLLLNFDNPNITNLTVCVVLGLHEFGTCQGGRSWALGGMATRMAHALQLHKEAEQDPMGKVHPVLKDYVHEGGDLGGYMSFTDKEIRRRCMWACFVMDRFNSSGTERPCMINETEIEIQLPVQDRNLELDLPAITEQLDGGVHDSRDAPEEDKLAQAAENMGVGAYLVRAIALYGRVVKYLNQGGKERDERDIWDPESHFAELNAEVESMIDDLPARLYYNKENLQVYAAEKLASQFLFLHICLQQVRLFLHRSALAGSNTPNQTSPSTPKEFAVKATEIAVESATKISDMIFDSQERGLSPLAPFVGYCAFNASLIHLVRMFSPQKRMQLEARQHLETCLRFLLQLRQYWGLFCSITDNLKMLYRKFSDASRKGAFVSGHQEASRMLQYGDWFLRYPKGVTINEYQESSARSAVPSEARSMKDDAALSHRSDLQTADEFFAQLGPQKEKHTLSAQISTITRPTQNITQLSSTSVSSNHIQSPIYGQAPASSMVPSVQESPTTSPIIIQSNSDTKELDAQVLSRGRLRTQDENFQGNLHSRKQQKQHSRHNSATTSVESALPTPTSFAGYSPMPAANSPTQTFHIPQTMAQHPTTSYLYDSYPRGSDLVDITSVNSNLWQGFDQQMNISHPGTLPDHTSSAWFLPFNSVPPEFDPVGLEALDALGSGVLPGEAIPGGEGRSHIVIEGGDAVPHMMPGGPVMPGRLPATASYDSNSGQ